MNNLTKYMVVFLLSLALFGCEAQGKDQGQEQPASSSLSVRASGKTEGCKTTEVEAVCRQQNGAWHHPVAPTDAVGTAGQNSDIPAVAIDDKGNGLIAWTRFDGTAWLVLAREYRDGKWQEPQTIYKAAGKAKGPKLGLSASGDGVLVWEQAGQSGNSILMAHRRNGTWNPPATISVGGKYAWEPDIDINGSGDAVIAWSQDVGSGVYAIYKSEFRNGNWNHPKNLKERISPAQGSDAVRARVALSDSGAALITWEQDINGTSQIFKSDYRENAWHHPADQNDFINPKSDSTRGAYVPLVAMDDRGNALIAWKQAHGNKDRIYMSEFRDGKWHHPESLENAISPPEIISADLNDLRMSGKGDALALWTSFKERHLALYKGEYRQGKWSHPAEGEPFVSAPQQWQFMIQGSAAMANDGRSVAAWLQRGDDNKAGAYFAEYEKGQWHLPGTLLNVGETPAFSFALSSSPKGNFIIAWEQTDGKDAQVYSSVYRLSE